MRDHQPDELKEEYAPVDAADYEKVIERTRS
jgi:hypothetical protein